MEEKKLDKIFTGMTIATLCAIGIGLAVIAIEFQYVWHTLNA